MADSSLTDIDGVGPKTAEKLRDDGYTSKEDVLEGFKDEDPALTDYSSRVVRGIRGELLDRGERFEDPEANVEVGPENRKAFEVFGETTVSDLDSVDTRAEPVSPDTSIASLAPKAASGELGRRSFGRDLTDFAVDAAANLGLTEMSAARAQEMNARGTNPTAARLGAPRPEDPFGVTVAPEPPVDRTNPERLEPKGLSLRQRDEPGERRRVQLTDSEARAAKSAFESRSVLDSDDDLTEEAVEETFFTVRDERQDDGTVELTPTQAETLSTVVSAAAQSERFTERKRVQRGTEDIEGAERIAAAADPTTEADADRVDPVLAARFDAEPAVSLFDTDRPGDDGDTGGGLFAFDDYGATSREPVPEAERQEVSSLGGVDRRRLQGTPLSVSDKDPAIDQPGATGDPGQFLPPDEEPDPPENVPEQLAAQREGALETARREFADQTDQDDDGTPNTAEVRLELPDSRAAEAGQLVARMGERGIVGDDVDEDTLASVRSELETVREGDGVLNLTDEQAEAFAEVIDDAGESLAPAQRPEGFTLLEDAAPAAGERSRPSSSSGQSDVSGRATETTREFDFGRRDIAQSVREDIPDAALTEKYDGRHTSIEVDTSQLTDRQVDRLAGEAADATAFEDEKAGQIELTERERSEIDFTETTVPEARSAKGIFAAQGVDDWLSFFDETLTVDEQRGIAQRAAREDQGRRTDFAEDTARQRMAGAFRAERENLREYAIEGARQGDEEAISVLIEDIGMDEQRARGFVEDTESEQERVAMMETVVARVEANGRFTNPPPERAPNSPGKRGRSSGQYIGDEVITPADPGAPIRRDPETGQFFVAEDERGRSGPPFGSVTETQVQRGDLR